MTTVGPTDATYSAQLAASSPADAWSAWTTPSALLLRHWDGQAWQVMSMPAALPAGSELDAFAASGPADAWAIGFDSSQQPVAARWDGTSWTSQALPSWVLRNTRGGFYRTAAAAFGQAGVWVFSLGAAAQPALAAHYDGSTWAQVKLPAQPVSVSALSPGDIWAAGVTVKSAAKPPAKQVWVAMHWNGRSWRSLRIPKVKLPAGPAPSRSVGDVVALGPANVWMLNAVSGGGSGPAKENLLHWNGAKWAPVKLGYPTSDVVAMAQDGHGGLWIAANGTAPGYVWYFYHHNGSTWSRQQLPSQPGATAQVGTLTWIPGSRSLWAGGELITGKGLTGVIFKYGP